MEISTKPDEISLNGETVDGDVLNVRRGDGGAP